MRKHTGFILGVIGFATGLYLLSRSARQKAVSQAGVATTDYKKVAYQDLASENLTDLNRGDASDLRSLGLSQALADRVIENRPYRSKLELVFEADSAGSRVQRDSRSDCGGRRTGSDQGRGLVCVRTPWAPADDGQPWTLLAATK
jgi:hypothetical protein